MLIPNRYKQLVNIKDSNKRETKWETDTICENAKCVVKRTRQRTSAECRQCEPVRSCGRFDGKPTHIHDTYTHTQHMRKLCTARVDNRLLRA